MSTAVLKPGRVGPRLLFAIVALLATASLGLFAARANAAGDVSDFSLTPSNLQAGGDPSITVDTKFQYATAGDTVKNITVVLPPGLLASLAGVSSANECTSTQLSAGQCPSGSQIGTASATIGALPAVSGSVYLMPAPNPATDISGLGVSFGTGAATITASGPVSFGTDGNGSPVLLLSVDNLPSSTAMAGQSLNELSVAINGTLPSGAPLTRMPSSCSAATSGVSIDTYSGSADGSLTSTPFTPTGCSNLPYAPLFSAAGAVTSASGGGVTVATAVAQAAGESATKALALAVPSNLSPNLAAAASMFCASPNPPTYSNCKSVGSATTTTPLLPAGVQLKGSVYLTGSLTSPALTVAFPEPFPIAFSGAINIINNSVTFSNVPDVPLTTLGVVLTGGSNALFTTTCSPSSGTASAQFAGQNGASVTRTTAFNITGCGSTTTKAPGKPTVKSVKLTGLKKGKPALSFGVHAGNNGAPKVRSVTVKLPGGVSFVKAKLKKGVSARGAKIKSAKLSGGRLTITLKSPVRSFSVKVASKALKETKSLETKVKKHKVKKEKVTITVKDAKNKKTSATVKVKV